MEFLYMFVVIVFVLIIKIIYDRKKNRHLLFERLNKAWGHPNETLVSEDELESIATYFKSVYDKEKDVDEITWNDLDMDEIFLVMNNTASSIGEEYLYAVLHKLKYEEKELLKRDQLITYFEHNKEKAIEVQAVLKYLGKLKNISIYEYINHFSKVEKDSNLKHYLQIIGFFVALAIAFVVPKYGVLLTAGMLSYNIVTYYRRKAEIDKYMTVCAYLVRMLDTVEQLKNINNKELAFIMDDVLLQANKLKSFKKGSFLVTSKNVNGNIGEIIFDYLRMIFHVDLIKFNSMLAVFHKEKEALNLLFSAIGLIDSMIAAASFRNTLTLYSKPQLIIGEDRTLDITDVYHPFIENPIPNSITTTSSVLLTGSNASGKSTFLRSIAINAILSQTIYTSLSSNYKGNYYKVMSSMALKDNLMGKESYYIVEIKSLKRIVDAVDHNRPILCFVDEVLRGTNTLERIAASSQILQSLGTNNVLCFAATHDIELTHILEDYFTNYHFQEEVADNQIFFDYKLYEGRAISRNAIKLLSIMGYDKSIIDNATDNANQFLKEGKWSKL